MKTAISVPDETYEAATTRARELGMSRSEFFATAARRYLDELDRRSTPARVQRVLDREGADPSNEQAADAGLRRLAAESDEW